MKQLEICLIFITFLIISKLVMKIFLQKTSQTIKQLIKLLPYLLLKMKIKDLMTKGCESVSEDTSIQKVAELMSTQSIGALPIYRGSPDQLVGMVTDRDITIRGVAKGLNLQTPVKDVMTNSVCCVNEEDDVAIATKMMCSQQIRRIIVKSADKKCVGMIALADIASCKDEKLALQALKGVSAN